jgi:hypothetical protein
VLTFKGLSRPELDRVIDFQGEEWSVFIAVYKSILFTFKGLWKISNEVFIKVVERKFLADFNFTKSIHKMIEVSLEKTPSSIRKLEELTNHLYSAKEFFALKQCIASIDNFLLLFNSFTKYDLCRYWQVLEEHDFDPVEQYNKGLELFDMHYSPKSDELFTIILQISRFLKEFTDFETRKTPEFRHPTIRGKVIQLKEGQKKNTQSVGSQNSSLVDLFKIRDAGSSENGFGASNCLAPFLDDVEVSEDDQKETKDHGDNKINY